MSTASSSTLLTLRQVADAIGCRHDYAYRLTGRLGARKSDGVWLFPADAVQVYLDTRRRVGAAA